MTIYGDITPRTAAFVVKELLDRSTPYFVFEKFGMSKPLPKNSTKSMTWRRYFLDSAAFTDSKYNPYEYYGQDDTGELFNATARTLTEGQTPSAIDLEHKDITVEIKQYGAWTQITDVIADTHEDPILSEAVEILSETGAVLLEQTRFDVLVAGSNKYCQSTQASKVRANVDKVIDITLQRLIVRGFKRNLARPITKVVRATANYGTEPISPAFVAVAHPDLESDIRALPGFVPSEKYGTMSPWEGEIGKVESVRYVLSTVVKSLGFTGRTTGYTGLINNASAAAVYPILYFAANAYAVVPLKGKSSVVPMVLNPNVPREGDPLGQRGSVGIKFYSATAILQDAWMARAEVACTDLAL